MKIETKISGNEIEVLFLSDIADDTIEEMSDVFQSIINNPTIMIAILNMKNVRMIPSSGIGKILKLYKHFNNSNGHLKLIKVDKEIQTLFKEIHLDKIIPIE